MASCMSQKRSGLGWVTCTASKGTVTVRSSSHFTFTTVYTSCRSYVASLPFACTMQADSCSSQREIDMGSSRSSGQFKKNVCSSHLRQKHSYHLVGSPSGMLGASSKTDGSIMSAQSSKVSTRYATTNSSQAKFSKSNSKSYRETTLHNSVHHLPNPNKIPEVDISDL